MDSVSPTTRAGTSVQMQTADPCSNTFWKSVGNRNRHWASEAEFAHGFEPYPRRYRVRESPLATGDGLVA
jgi:hypothetical protein